MYKKTQVDGEISPQCQIHAGDKAPHPPLYETLRFLLKLYLNVFLFDI
jgi:hypothetical protein